MDKPISEVNFNNSMIEIGPIKKLNSSPFISDHNANLIPIRENRNVYKDFDKVSVYTQPSPNTIIKVSPPKRQ